jgi:predicted PurR-regulated permease PerM
MSTISEKPLYQKISLNLFIIIAIGFLLYIGKDILMPFLFSILIASLLLPAVSYFQKKGLGRSASILIPVSLTLISIIVTLYFFSSQISNFLKDYDTLQSRIGELAYSVKKWISSNIHITFREQNKYFNETVEKLKDQGPNLLSVTIASLTTFISYFVLLPIYTFLILYYRESIRQFLIGVFKNGSEEKIKEILEASTLVTRQYIIGLLVETSIVFALNSFGFLILGIKYAIFLALLAALLNLVPYIGMLIANVICMLITLVSSNNPADVIWVGIILAAVQVLDNNFGMPLVVGTKIRINALSIILGVLVGGALCGIPGMFLSIPGLAVMKVIFEHVPSLRPWGLLLSDQSPSLRLHYGK